MATPSKTLVPALDPQFQAAIDEGICALYLAIVRRRQGCPDDEAAALAAEAFRLSPGQPWMQVRWEWELASPGMPTTPRPTG